MVEYTLKQKLKSINMTLGELQKRLGVSSRTMAKFAHNEPVSLTLLDKICNELDCGLDEIVTLGKTASKLLQMIIEEKNMQLSNGLYHEIQILFSYNSNRIEGSKLSLDETRFIYETHTVEGKANTDDIIETVNHFRCFDYMIDTVMQPLTEDLIKEFHRILKTGTSDSAKTWFNVGDYKLKANVVGGMETCKPQNVHAEMEALIANYRSKRKIRLTEIAELHYNFEKIHPFQDGNGRVGRLVMFRECLKNKVTPFIVDEEHKFYYYRGLKEFAKESGFLLGTFESLQDDFRVLLNTFNVVEEYLKSKI